MGMADVQCAKCGHYMSEHKAVNRENSVCHCGCQLGPARRDDLLDEIDELAEKLAETKSAMEALAKQETAIKYKMATEHIKEHNDFVSEVSQLKEDLKKAKEFHRECVDSHKYHIQDLYEAAGADIVEGFNTTEEAVEFVRNLRASCNHFKKEVSSLHERLAKVCNERDDAVKELVKTRNEHLVAVEKLKHTDTEEMAELKSKLVDSRNEALNLRIDLAAVDDLWHSAEDKAYALENEVDKLQDELAKLKK